MTHPYRRLNPTERRYLCSFVRLLIPAARDSRHPMQDLARRQIALTMWRWTADAFHIPSGIVKQDAFKYNVDVHAATESARIAAAAGSAGLRHEHAVPRMALARHIIEHDLDEEAIFHLLDRLCIPVIVTVEEDRALRPKNDMPEGWDWSKGNPYERYIRSGLYQKLQWPSERE